MSSNLTPIVAGTLPLASDVQQFIDMFNGINDVGAITLAQPISSPSISGIAVAAASGNALGVGTYEYAFTWVVGYDKTDGMFVFGGETPASATITLTTTSGNQAATLTGLPTTWPSTALALRIYRTAVGASTLQVAATLTAKQSVYTDTTPDASLTNVQPPSANTTGTYIAESTLLGKREMLPNYDQYMSAPDANDIYTVVTLKRPDGTTYLVSTLSNVVNGYYETDTWQFYDSTGTGVVKTHVWTLAYDASGRITSKVMSS